MSLVHEEYQKRIDELPPLAKLARVEALLCWTRNLIARQVRAELGDKVSDERVRWEVALRMYDADPTMARLIQEQIARVSS